MKEINPRDRLALYCAGHTNQRTAATALGISQQYLNDLILGRRELSARMLAKLGLRTVTIQQRGKA